MTSTIFARDYKVNMTHREWRKAHKIYRAYKKQYPTKLIYNRFGTWLLVDTDYNFSEIFKGSILQAFRKLWQANH